MVKDKKEKKENLSTKKLNKLKQATITAKKTETENEIIIDIFVGECIEPSMRHRDRGNGFGKYDPLHAYKKYLAKTVMEQLDLKEPLEGKFTAYIKYYRTCNADASELYRLMALAQEVVPLTKPDNDNVIKTVQDTFNKLIFKDDVQIPTVNMEKYYSQNNSTYIRFVYDKTYTNLLDSIKGKRVNKKIREEYEEKIKNIKEGF